MQLIPYIMFNGNCEEALKFYEKALGGSIGQINRYSDLPPGTPGMGMDGDKIMHTDFKVNGNVIFLTADGPGQDRDSGMVSLSLNFTDPGSLQSTFAKMSDGGDVTMPLQDRFWGATFGMLQDKFGIKWMFNYDKPKS